MKNFFLLLFILPVFNSNAQQIKVVQVKNQQKVLITIDGKPFTAFCYPDSLEKPFLYPIYAPDGEIITRGFPLQPRAGEPIDHPHHIGLWFDYENVNGLDFWNNSYAIPAEKKHSYGWIKIDAITMASSIKKKKGGDRGIIQYTAKWVDQQKNVLLEENTILLFSATRD